MPRRRASSIALNVRWRSIASGVVRTTSCSTPPMTLLTVPSSPVDRPARLEQRPGQERRGGLAVGPGDPDHLKGRGRIAIEAGGGGSHGLPAIRHLDLGHRHLERAFHHQGHRSPLHRLGGEVVPVPREPGDTEEERPGDHVAIVIGQTRDLEIPGGRRDARDHLVEAHRGPSVGVGPEEARRPLVRASHRPGGRLRAMVMPPSAAEAAGRGIGRLPRSITRSTMP